MHMRQATTALLVIDVHSGSEYSSQASETISNIRTLVKSFRSEERPVIFVKFPGDKIHPKLRPRKDEVVMDKSFASAFNNTPMRQILRDRKVQRLVVGGFFTQLCVLSTVLEGARTGYEIAVVRECCFPAGPGTFQGEDRKAFKRMDDAGVAVLSSCELPSFVKGHKTGLLP